MTYHILLQEDIKVKEEKHINIKSEEQVRNWK